MRTGWLEGGVHLATKPEPSARTLPPLARETGQLLGVWIVSAIPAVVATRHQYTWSLLLFIAPLLLTGHALHRRGALRPLLRPALLALALLVPMGGVLTVGLADDFFVYPNEGAVLGLTFPAIDLGGVDHAARIPVEELAFYLLGFAALLSLYAWADAVLLPAPRPLRQAPRVTWAELAVGLATGLALTAAGWALQRVTNPASPAPAYFAYLMLVPLPVMLACGPAVAHRINWPALALVCLALWGHSILWEVTLAIPQGWWGYQQPAMLGLSIHAWHELPLEAVLVWLMTPVATVITFETLRAGVSPLHRSTTDEA
ncbi:MAG: hypothetical protein ACOZQL_11275 [Myxococcota bacterium]